MVDGGAFPDTAAVLYIMDLQAGFYVQSQGDLTSTPVVCQFVPVNCGGVVERTKDEGGRMKSATVLRRLPAGAVAFDAMGRRVLNPKPGIYFVRERSAAGGERPAIRKVVVTR
jgi:hypothetical protein